VETLGRDKSYLQVIGLGGVGGGVAEVMVENSLRRPGPGKGVGGVSLEEDANNGNIQQRGGVPGSLVQSGQSILWGAWDLERWSSRVTGRNQCSGHQKVVHADGVVLREMKRCRSPLWVGRSGLKTPPTPPQVKQPPPKRGGHENVGRSESGRIICTKGRGTGGPQGKMARKSTSCSGLGLRCVVAG